MKLVSAKCPNCGAEIEVDKNSDSTKCDYCGSKIIVEDAIEKYKIEISGSVQVNNLPTIENYIKLGDRHYNDREYNEAYSMYNKALELNPDNAKAVARAGFCKALSSSYENFQVQILNRCMKNAYNILKQNTSKEELYTYISEAEVITKSLSNILVERYKRSPLGKDEVEPFNEKIMDCLNTFEYLYSIVGQNKTLKIVLIERIIEQIDNYCLDKAFYGDRIVNGTYLKQYYKLNKATINALNTRKMDYQRELEYLRTGVIPADKQPSNDKRTKKIRNTIIDNIADKLFATKFMRAFSETTVLGKLLQALGYFSIFIFGILALTNMVNGGFFIGYICFVSIFSFNPALKKIIIKKSGVKVNTIKLIYLIIRIISIVIVFAGTIYTFANIPPSFNGRWTSKSGEIVIFEENSNKVILQTTDGVKYIGEYTHTGTVGISTTATSIYATFNEKITMDENGESGQPEKISPLKYEFRYNVDRENKLIRLYLCKNGKPQTFYLPENKDSIYTYTTSE